MDAAGRTPNAEAILVPSSDDQSRYLLLRIGETALGEIMKTAHSKYAGDFNASRGTDGHVTRCRRTKAEIAAEVAKEADLEVEELTGPSRARDISGPRSKAMALMYEGVTEPAKLPVISTEHRPQ